MNTPSDQMPPNPPPAAGTPPPSPPHQEPASVIDPQERQWGMFAHLSALVGGFVTTGWAGSIGCFLGPLIIWLVKKDTMPFVDDQGKEALNFNITFSIAALVCLILFLIFIGYLLMAALWVLWLVFVIMAAIKSGEGEVYRYPFTMRFIR